MSIVLDHSEASPSPDALDRHISRASKALIALQRGDGHWCFELEADATIPAEYVLLRHFRGEKPDLELERLIAVYLRRIQGAHGGWPIFHDGPVRHQRQRQGLFWSQDDRRRSRRAAYAPRARSHPRPWRRGQEQCLHPLPSGAIRRHPLERRSDHAGRDHAAAALVSVPSRQGLLLGAHGDGPAPRPAGPEAARRQSAPALRSGSCSRRRRRPYASGRRARIRPGRR